MVDGCFYFLPAARSVEVLRLLLGVVSPPLPWVGGSGVVGGFGFLFGLGVVVVFRVGCGFVGLFVWVGWAFPFPCPLPPSLPSPPPAPSLRPKASPTLSRVWKKKPLHLSKELGRE